MGDPINMTQQRAPPMHRTQTADTASLLFGSVVCLSRIVDVDHQRSSAGLVIIIIIITEIFRVA